MKTGGSTHSEWKLRAAGWCGLALLLAYVDRKSGVLLDDVYISLTYARNLAVGAGMVFRPGEAVLGVTTPLWCWLNGLGFLVLDAARFGALGCRLLFLATTLGAAIAIERLARRGGFGNWGLLAAAGFVLLPAHTYLYGVETSLGVWLAAESLLAFAGRRLFLSGVLSGLLVLTRPEAACLPVLIAAAELVFSRSVWGMLRFAAGAALPLVPAIGWLWMHFGSPIPNTLAAKQAQLGGAHAPWSVGMAVGAWRYLLFTWLRGAAAPALLLVLGGWRVAADASDAVRRRELPERGRVAVWLALIWAVLHVASLSLLGVAFYDWYLYPVWLACLLLFAAGGYSLWTLCTAAMAHPGGEVAARMRRLAIGLAAAILVVSLAAWQAPWSGDPAAVHRARLEGYRALAAAMERRTAPNEPAAVLAYEIGALGFYLPNRVRIVDEFFLVRRVPPDGRLPTRPELIASEQTRFLVESLPLGPRTAPADAEALRGRTRPGFELRYPRSDGKGELVYRPVEAIDGLYGLQILYEREEPWSAPDTASAGQDQS